MNEYTIPNLQITISDPETLKVIADSLRLQILKQLKEPKTVKDVGAALETAPAKLYYHFSLLEKHELIRVVDTRLVSGIVEKHYQVTARRYKVDDQLLAAPEDAAEHLEGLLDAIFDNAKSEIKKSVGLGLMPLGKDVPCKEGAMVQAMLYPSEEELADFCNRLQPLIDECESWDDSEIDDSRQPFGLFMAFYPVAQENK